MKTEPMKFSYAPKRLTPFRGRGWLGRQWRGENPGQTISTAADFKPAPPAAFIKIPPLERAGATTKPPVETLSK